MGDKEVPFSKGDLFGLKKWVAFELGLEVWSGVKEMKASCLGKARSKVGGA